MAVSPAFAQTASSPVTLDRVVVTGNPFGSDLLEMVSPASLLSGQRLEENRQPTLGEMLNVLPGVNSSYYGPNASRPVIRGLDGDRIRILQNGVGTLDASGTSVDHAVALDPLTVKRVEVVRGPGTLLYGPAALGGVVNVIDTRIATDPVEGVHGGASGQYSSSNAAKQGAIALDAGANGFVLHADAFKRRTDDLKIPGFARSARLRSIDPLSDAEEAHGRLPNSASDSNGGAIGGSFVGATGSLGAAYSEFNSSYGTVAEESVTIGMKQKRLDVAGELLQPTPWLKSLKFKFGHSDYQHTEFAGGEPGTVFRNKGYEARIDATHGPIAGFDGVVGVQMQQFDFSALGEEGFLPLTHTKTLAGFVFEETKWRQWKLQAGARADRAEVSADEDEKFGPASKRSFTTGSGSLGAAYTINEAYSLVFSTVYTSRAPNYQELYANGPHLATGIAELGDRRLSPEKSLGFDASIRRRTGPLTGSAGVFYNRFNNFITLFPTGDTNADFKVPIFAYRQTRAEFYGVELEGKYAVGQMGPGELEIELQGDWLRASDLSNNQPLPRISPLRFGGALVYRTERWGTRLELMRVEKQDRVAPGELPTDGYTMVNLSLSYRVPVGASEATFFIKGSNLLNEEARNHVSFLKDIAPMPARGVTVGLRGTF